MQSVSPKVEGRQSQGGPGWGYCKKPCIKNKVFKGNKEECEKYVFISAQGDNKQAAQYMEGLCEHIEKNLKWGD